MATVIPLPRVRLRATNVDERFVDLHPRHLACRPDVTDRHSPAHIVKRSRLHHQHCADSGSFQTFVSQRSHPSIRTTRPLPAALSKATSSPWSSTTGSRRVGM